MKRRSLLSSVLQILFLAILALLWWSSTLIEEDLKKMQNHLDSIEKKIESTKRLYRTSAASLHNQSAPPALIQNNLLQNDPFYEGGLQSLLPPNFTPHGSYTTANVGRPENLLPFSGYYEVSSMHALCVGNLATTWEGFYEKFAPCLAEGIEVLENIERNTIDYKVYLRKDIYWEPVNPDLFSQLQLAEHFLKRHPVTSNDYLLNYQTIMNPHVQLQGALGARPSLEDIEEIEIIDEYTFIVRWKAKMIEGKLKAKYLAKNSTFLLSPLAGFLYKYYPDGTKIVEDDSDPDTYRKSSLYAQAFFQHWASQYIPSAGIFVFEGISNEGVSFSKNYNYPHPLRTLFDKRDDYFKSSQDNVWNAFQGLKIDVCSITSEQVLDLKQFLESDLYKKQKSEGKAVHRLDFPQKAFTYIGWNQKRAFFADTKVRLAMTHAINRKRIIEQFISGKGKETTGSFYIESPSYNKNISPYPYNPFRAEQLLDEAGWLFNKDLGIREKEVDGKKIPFRFSLIYYVKNSVAKSIVEYISTSLKRIGVECTPLGVDIADLSAKTREKEFDATFLAWMQGLPPEDPRQLWHSSYADLPGSSNYIGFKNAEADELIDKLTYEDDPEKRKALYHKFHEILHKEQPYTFLYIPIETLLWREHIRNVFIPKERQDIIPGAQTIQPSSSIFYKVMP